MGEKTPKNIYTRKTRKNSPFGFPPIPPSIKLEADCFLGRKNRKQAGPTLGGTGIQMDYILKLLREEVGGL